MDRLIAEVRAALENGAFVIALQGSLACIDICAALNSSDGSTRRTHFKTWFDAQLGSTYSSLSADDVYQLRCGMLHQGRASAHQYSAIVFTLPDGRGNVFHNNILNDALNLDLVTFVTDVLGAVGAWWTDSQSHSQVASNAAHLIQVRPNGLAPYIVGTPVLA
jgi:hypothetical protein